MCKCVCAYWAGGEKKIYSFQYILKEIPDDKTVKKKSLTCHNAWYAKGTQ